MKITAPIPRAAPALPAQAGGFRIVLRGSRDRSFNGPAAVTAALATLDDPACRTLLERASALAMAEHAIVPIVTPT